MPECYANVYVAMRALMRGGHTVASQPAFQAGAGGPASLFMYKIWKKNRKPNLPALAARMHHEKTGRFLVTLASNAMTPVQQSYALGFITNYTSSCTLNPYIEAMSTGGMPYDMPGGRWILGTAIDSELYYTDYKTRLVPLHAGTPVLITDHLAQVATLLRDSIHEVYGYDIPLLALTDAFHDNRFMHSLLISPLGVKRLLARMLQPKNPKKYGGPYWFRTQPGKKLKRLPKEWKNPGTGAEMDFTFTEVISLAEQTAAAAITATMGYWLGNIDEDALAMVLGNNDYYTGLTGKSEDAPPENSAEETAPPTIPQDDQEAS